MFALGVFSVLVFIGILFLIYCFIAFNRELSGKRRHFSNVTRLPGHPGTICNKNNISRITMAGLSLVLPMAGYSQTS